jgi:heme-degrading monooxygenase HmoA
MLVNEPEWTVIVAGRRSYGTCRVEEYQQLALRLCALAESLPGFVSAKTLTAADGERVSIEEFESPETLEAWRNHPAHREAQRLGREKFYAEFHNANGGRNRSSG